MNQETVSAESGEVVVDGRRGGVEDPGDLAVGGARDGVFVDLQQEFGTFEPVGGAEGLVAEGASASSAAVTLDDMGRVAAAEGAEADVGPGPGLRAVVLAVRVGAMGRGRGAWKWCGGVHAAGPGKAWTRQQSSRYVSGSPAQSCVGGPLDLVLAVPDLPPEEQVEAADDRQPQIGEEARFELVAVGIRRGAGAHEPADLALAPHAV